MSSSLPCYQRYRQENQSLSEKGLGRTPPEDPPVPLIDFSHNDYLGLSGHPLVIQGAQEALSLYGTGGRAAPTLQSQAGWVRRLERRLAHDKNKEAVLLFSSGFQANTTVLTALLKRTILRQPPAVFMDRLNHNSLYQGCLASGCHPIRYQHLDLRHLETLLSQNASPHKFVITESIFGMDGDQVDLPQLIALCKKYQAFLYIDEAHGTGVYGPRGYGLTEGFEKDIDVIMGTFSKALGCMGAYVACNQELADYLRVHGGGYLFSTAPSPMVLGAVQAAWSLLPQLHKERSHLLQMASKLRHNLQSIGYRVGGSGNSHIITVFTDPSEQVKELASFLRERGCYVTHIRPPTVPTERLRLILNAQHTVSDIHALWEGMNEFLKNTAKIGG